MNPKDSKGENRDGGEALRFAEIRLGVYKRLKAVVAFPVVVALCAAATAAMLPKRFDAVATIQIDPRQRSKTEIAREPSDTKINRPPIESEIRILRSEPVIRRAIDTLHLESDPEFKPRWPIAFIGRLFGVTDQAETEAAIHNRLSVSRVRNTLLVSIRVSSSNPAKSARVANAIANAYLQEWSEANSSLEAAAQMMGQGPGTAAQNGAPESASERVFQSLMSERGGALQVPGPRIISTAKPPAHSTAPRREHIVAFAFALGLLAAIAVAALLELRSSSHVRTSRVKAAFACPHMTSLPAIETKETAPARACRFVLAEPAGNYAEAVRETCRELEKRRSGAPSRLTLVVSALPGEGAECLASNIAHQYAVAGHSPLLVDADLRMKNLTRLLAGESPCGLLDQIASRQPIEKAILRDCATGLHFLPASGPAPIPLPIRDVLRSKAFTDAIATLKQNFVTIVLSAPPLLTFSDAHVLAELADEIVFATAWQKTPRRLAKKALATIGSHQNKLAGAALTEIVDRDSASIMSLYEVLDEMRSAALPPFKAHAA
jgi:Mrp family chromosome partitioning ATPase/capsular polysaccharide biosynthesis protein